MSIAEQLRALREARGLSIPDVAEATGIDRSGLHKIEKGERGASSATLETLLAFYGARILPEVGEPEGAGQPAVTSDDEQAAV
jgi:transcriptional regulator with XRE-family HTH domain